MCEPNQQWLSRKAALFGAVVLAVPGTAEEGIDDDRVHEVIIVTAENPEEDILSVPVTMTAFSQDMLEELGMTGDEVLEQLVPGLQFACDWGWLTGPRQIGIQVRYRPQL
ncbi:MAG: hypothetical protein OXH68_15995 [Gammaproteobacteria bacterium]|nr:hypothetical protein [Gammaproteobacteria bacterium]